MKHNIDDIFDIDFDSLNELWNLEVDWNLDFQFDFDFNWNTDDLQREKYESNVKTLQMLHYKKDYSY